MTKIVLVTGASGFIGQALCAELASAGLTPVGLVRDPVGFKRFTGFNAYRCELPHNIDPEIASTPAIALVHLAYDTRFQSADQAYFTNIRGTENLIGLLNDSPIRKKIFISSMSAHKDALSIYGRSKFHLEEYFKNDNDLIIRPGLVIGGGGLFDRMLSNLKSLRAVPIVHGGRQPIHPLDVRDLTLGIVKSIQLDLGGVLNLGSILPSTLKEFYKQLSKQVGKTIFFIRLPLYFTLIVLKLFERLRIKLPISSENLLGMVALKAFETEDSWKRLHLNPRLIATTLSWSVNLNRDKTCKKVNLKKFQ